MLGTPGYDGGATTGDRVFLYEFDLQWRHHKMGYGRRTIVPEAPDAETAIRLGRDKIAGNGEDFDLVSLKRGRIAGRSS